MANIVVNQIKTPDGTILRSFHRHDYVVYTDANGYTYMVDGGKDYLRRGGSGCIVAPAEEMSVYDDSPHDVIRSAMTWGTLGKDGMGPRKYVVLKDLETAHIEAILATQTHISATIRQIMQVELNYRKAQYVD
jgi:hypothetical protein